MSFLLHENASKWEEEEKNGSRGKGKGGKNVFGVTKETNSNERDQTERLIDEIVLLLPRQVNSPL